MFWPAPSTKALCFYWSAEKTPCPRYVRPLTFYRTSVRPPERRQKQSASLAQYGINWGGPPPNLENIKHSHRHRRQRGRNGFSGNSGECHLQTSVDIFHTSTGIIVVAVLCYMITTLPKIQLSILVNVSAVLCL